MKNYKCVDMLGAMYSKYFPQGVDCCICYAHTAFDRHVLLSITNTFNDGDFREHREARNFTFFFFLPEN